MPQFLRQLSDAGITSYLPTVPADLAILDQNAVLDVLDADPRDYWVVGGHSPGGVAAAKMAGQESNIVGLSFMGLPSSIQYKSQQQHRRSSKFGGLQRWCSQLGKLNNSFSQLPSSTHLGLPFKVAITASLVIMVSKTKMVQLPSPLKNNGLKPARPF